MRGARTCRRRLKSAGGLCLLSSQEPRAPAWGPRLALRLQPPVGRFGPGAGEDAGARSRGTRSPSPSHGSGPRGSRTPPRCRDGGRGHEADRARARAREFKSPGRREAARVRRAQKPGCVRVVSPWSAPTPDRCHPANYPHVVPQVRALSTDQDRTPKAGVGSSNLPRRTGVPPHRLCRTRRACRRRPSGSRVRHAQPASLEGDAGADEEVDRTEREGEQPVVATRGGGEGDSAGGGDRPADQVGPHAPA